ncbi:hypothetical protein [Chryseobacterium geocarposphaerae]|uniref:6-bladed beta-propeller protein n=1 Tax=Chryseobacterium geocarposphaerae TaxID=1416776 RepID=A0A2M9C8V7_9FLAO|nr:hypothetical protein [Chryseobacterium geocarposphaerae]PJJ67283.1 hypothetical protein CLV73_1286 [Chryseobacterium geocarposphaerae]
MRFLYIILFFFFCSLSAQKVLPLDSLKLKEAGDMLADDYGNLYIYKNKDFSFTKYDSTGKQIGKMMLTVPFKPQNVQNPLSVALFSENAQELKFVDQNLNEIQRVDFKQKFSFIKYAYAEDLQQIWLMDESMKRLIQYNFRNETTINSYPFDANFDDLIDLLVYDNKVYVLTKKQFRVFTLKFEKLFEAEVENGKRFRRENDMILIITKNTILRYIPDKELVKIFDDPDAQIVDKNTLAYFEIKANKLYLYTLENNKETKPPAEPVATPKDNKDPKEYEEKKEQPDLIKLMEEVSEVQSLGIDNL